MKQEWQLLDEFVIGDAQLWRAGFVCGPQDWAMLLQAMRASIILLCTFSMLASRIQPLSAESGKDRLASCKHELCVGPDRSHRLGTYLGLIVMCVALRIALRHVCNGLIKVWEAYRKQHSCTGVVKILRLVKPLHCVGKLRQEAMLKVCMHCHGC